MDITEEYKLNFISSIKDYSLENGDKAAIIFQDKSITYDDFIKSYHRVEKVLTAAGIREFHRIATVISDDLLSALISLPILEKSILVQLDPEFKKEQLKDYLELLKIDFVLIDCSHQYVEDAANESGIGIIKADFDESGINIELGSLSQPSADILQRNSGSKEFVSIKTTSGTTSRPKIVPITAAMYTAAARRYQQVYSLDENDVTLIVPRMHKTLAFSTTVRTMLSGGTTVLSGGFKPAVFQELLIKHKVTNMAVPPAILSSYAGFIEAKNIEPAKTNLRYARTSGAPLSKKLKASMEAFLDVRLDQSYGMSETFNISGTYKQPHGYREGSAGISSGLEVKTLNGEILVKGESVFPGYENEEIDNDIYFTDGWFHTGDLGHIDSDGYIYVTGRIKEMINRGGEKISPYEVETAIMKHPDIRDVVVFPYPNEYGSENAAAAIIMHDGFRTDLENLRGYLKGAISSFKMPTLLYIVDDFPVEGNGKVIRRKLYDYFQEGNYKAYESRKKLNPAELSRTERKLLKIWQSVLKTKIADKNAAFTDLGGDSLNGVIALEKIEEAFGVRIPVDMLFEEGTIEGISDFIESRSGHSNELNFIVPVKISGDSKPLICIHSITGDETTYRYIGKYMDKDIPVYAVKFRSHGHEWPVPLTFDALGRCYADEIRKLDPQGPYYLCGNCWGGVLAYKVASILMNDGCKVHMLALFDSATAQKNSFDKKIERRFKVNFINVLQNSIDQLKDKTFREKVFIVIRKAGNTLNLLKMTQSRKLYSYGYRKNIKFIMRLTGKTGALGFAGKRFIPEPFEGRLHFFKAMRGILGKSRNHIYWESMAGDFELYEYDCHHNDMMIGKDARKLAGDLAGIMKDAVD